MEQQNINVESLRRIINRFPLGHQFHSGDVVDDPEFRSDHQMWGDEDGIRREGAKVMSKHATSLGIRKLAAAKDNRGASWEKMR